MLVRPPALPLNDKLDAVAGLQDLPELGNPEAVGPAEGDAFRQPHHKQLLWVHQELGVGHLDGLRDANGLGCGDTAAIGPPGAVGPPVSTPNSHLPRLQREGGAAATGATALPESALS